MTPVQLCHLLKNDELWHDIKEDFLSIYGCLSISHVKGCRNHIISKDVEKFRNCNYKICVHSRLHIDAQVLTSHVGKTVELWRFGCDSITISEAHITFWIFFINAQCNAVILLECIREARRSENCVAKKMGAEKFWVSDITFFSCTPFPCFIFLSLLSWSCLPFFLSHVLLERPLGGAFRTLSNI